jgi:hypothetical protein
MQSTDNERRSSHVSAETTAECPFSMAQEYAADYLRAAEKGGPESVIRVPWGIPVTLEHHVGLTFGMHQDETAHGRSQDEVRVIWKSGSALLPDFRGSIRFRIDGLRTRVAVDGTYAPPFGAFGRLFDGVVGHAIAQASVRDLAHRIAVHLSERERTWRATHRETAAGGV